MDQESAAEETHAASSETEIYQIFNAIFEESIKDFSGPLNFLRDNEYGLVWENEIDLHEKTMKHAKKFVLKIAENFRVKHELVKHVEGSACDMFENFFTEKMNEFAKDSMETWPDCSLQEIKSKFSSKISRIKEKLENATAELPRSSSDIENMISDTELFDPIHIHHALVCCRAASECKDPENSEKWLEESGEKHLLSDFVVSYSENQDNVPGYVMARCGNVLYVAFRAFSSIPTQVGLPKQTWRGRISSSVFGEAVKIPLGYFAREIFYGRRIIFSGHSSGGAIASLVVVLLLEKFKGLPKEFLRTNLKCITFGVTPVGDDSFRELIDSTPDLNECFCHIVNENDVIPKLFGNKTKQFQNALHKLFGELRNVVPPNYTLYSGILSAVQALLHEYNMGEYFLPTFAIFGVYYILYPSSKSRSLYRRVAAAEAKKFLHLGRKRLANLHIDYLTHHTLERYQHNAQVCFSEGLSEKLQLQNTPTKPRDIFPKINDVQFENIGNQVVAKIRGSSMWFVHEVSICCNKLDSFMKLNVEIERTTEGEVQSAMPVSELIHENEVSVRLKTHFQNPKSFPVQEVPSNTTTYEVSQRQEQLAKLSPRKVIELAYLSALLERHDKGKHSKKYRAIKAFFEGAVSVVPVESLFHAMATSDNYTVAQCCDLMLSVKTFPSPSNVSELLCSGMEAAIKNIQNSGGLTRDPRNIAVMMRDDRGLVPTVEHSDVDMRFFAHLRQLDLRDTLKTTSDHHLTFEQLHVIQKAYLQIGTCLAEVYSNVSSVCAKSLCGLNLEFVYPSSDTNVTAKHKSCKAPVTLLADGRKKIERFIEEINEKLCSDETFRSSNCNSMMLQVLNNLQRDFKTCSALLGAFMESQVKVPLQRQGKRSLDKFVEQVNIFGLDIWGLLIIPFHDFGRLLDRLPAGCKRLVVDLTSSVYSGVHYLSHRNQEVANYEGKMKFLVTSMKKSYIANREFVTYSLERQLEKQCSKRNIRSTTPLQEILEQWQTNFDEETLTLVPERYRPLIARWIKWSLMINDLRESIAEQTAIGVIGLVNSGKSKFVRSIFGIKTVTGTTSQRRTTVPFIYNLEPDIKGMNVIDFPGVDDEDKSIPELAKLLLSLTRIVVFVVDYKRAHTQATQEWLKVLEDENVPVLVCLSFADKLYAELMGENGDRATQEIKAQIDLQLEEIEKVIGQSEFGRRDIMFTVFSFDNDSNLSCDEGKTKLRQAGLKDELDVGRWIAGQLEGNQQNDLSQSLLTFIEGKTKSTLNLNKSIRQACKRAAGVEQDKEKDGHGITSTRHNVMEDLDESKPCSTAHMK